MKAKAPVIIDEAVKTFLSNEISFWTLLEIMVAAWLPWIYQDEEEGTSFMWTGFGAYGWEYPIYYWTEFSVERFRIYVCRKEEC